MNESNSPTPNELLLKARWVAPMNAPMIDGGMVRVRGGRIIEVGRALSGEPLELGDVVLLPGLVNAHTHLELSASRQGEKPASFGEWLMRIVTRRMAATHEERVAAVTEATLAGAAESLSFGVTTVGDISRECSVTRPALRNSPLNVVSFGEVQAMATRRGLLEERLSRVVDETFASARLKIGITPHAPYTVEPEAYRRCVQVARERALPICTHLAETIEESRFLSEQEGPLKELWTSLGSWDEHVPRWPAGPIDLARAVGLLELPALLAHVNYVADAELDVLARSEASVVFCPRTHAYFEHAPHRWREMLARGMNVCVGTDGRGSSPDLNVVDDLRLLREQAPEVAPETLWEMVTIRAAKALGTRDVGAIDVGMRADLVAFEARSGEPLEEILDTRVLPRQVFGGGASIQ